MNLMGELIQEREKLIPKFCQWAAIERRDLNHYRALSKLLGFPQEYMAVLEAVEEPEKYKPFLEVLRKLNGPNGYTIYRMMVLKKNSLQEKWPGPKRLGRPSY